MPEILRMPEVAAGAESALLSSWSVAEGVLPAGIRARHIEGINGLKMHVLEAGFETKGRPLVLRRDPPPIA